MADNKVNMALDDIIKMNKQQQKKGKAPQKAARGKQQNNRNVRAASTRKAPVAARKGQAATSLSSVQTKKLVQKLVKKALKTRMAAAQRTNAPVRRGGVRARGVSTRPALTRVNVRSRAIQRRAPIQPATFVRVQPPTIVYEDEYVAAAPRRRNIPVVRRRVAAPVITQQVFTARQGNPRAGRVRLTRGAVVAANSFGGQRPAVRRVVLAQPPPRVQQVQQRTIRRRAPQQRVIQQRVIQQRAPQQRVIQQRAPQQRASQQRAPQQRVEYVQTFPQRTRGNGNARFRKNERFLSAIGGGQRGFARQTVDRFEPIGSFINSGSVVRRGRGFTNNY